MSDQRPTDDIATLKGMLTSKDGRKLKNVAEIGSGGQGRVFSVTSEGENSLALKWYHPPKPEGRASYEDQRLALEELIHIEPPDPRFLWPLDMVYHQGQYGYLMRLRPPEYKSIEDIILGLAKFDRCGPYRALTAAGMNLASCFGKLHREGYCYKDINFGGPFVRPDTGDVLICDNDNVRANRKTKSVVFYPAFAAPEVNRGEAICTTATDAHSLAVLLFYLFMRGHPLEGRREIAVVVFEANAKMRTFGTDPLFVFDPRDTSNRPVSGIQNHVIANWGRLPAFAQKVFEESFTEGLKNPDARPLDDRWQRLMSRLRDSLHRCRRCGLDSFVDLAAVRSRGETQTPCGFCGTMAVVPPRVVFADAEVCISDGCNIYPHHLGRAQDSPVPIATFSRHETKHELIGLKNLTANPFHFVDPDGTSREVPPGRSVSVVEGRQVNFGFGTGTMHWAAPATGWAPS